MSTSATPTCRCATPPDVEIALIADERSHAGLMAYLWWDALEIDCRVLSRRDLVDTWVLHPDATPDAAIIVAQTPDDWRAGLVAEIQRARPGLPIVLLVPETHLDRAEVRVRRGLVDVLGCPVDEAGIGEAMLALQVALDPGLLAHLEQELAALQAEARATAGATPTRPSARRARSRPLGPARRRRRLH